MDELRHVARALSAGLPLAALAARFVLLWGGVRVEESRALIGGTMPLMVMEFVLIGIGAFLGTSRAADWRGSRRAKSLLVAGCLMLFALPLALMTHSWLVLVALAWMFGEAVLRGRPGTEGQRQATAVRTAVAGSALLLLAVVATLISRYELVSHALMWVSINEPDPRPSVVVPWAAMYFGVMACVEARRAWRAR